MKKQTNKPITKNCAVCSKINNFNSSPRKRSGFFETTYCVKAIIETHQAGSRFWVSEPQLRRTEYKANRILKCGADTSEFTKRMNG